MKFFKNTFIFLSTFSSFLFSGGDFTLAEIDEIVADNRAFYLGIGVGTSSVNFDYYDEQFSSSTVSLQMGYQWNTYIALEGRYMFGFSTQYDIGVNPLAIEPYEGEFSSWGLYMKPMYPVTSTFDVYGLLGYGAVALSKLNYGDSYQSSFQWGLGAQYRLTDEWIVFIDYLSLYSGTGFDYVAQSSEVDSHIWTLGLSYTF